MSADNSNNEGAVKETKLDNPLTSTINIPNDQANTATNQSAHNNQDCDYHFGSYNLRYDPLAIIFAIALFAGGVAGVVSKGSLMSLIVSTLAAILIAIGVYVDGIYKTILPSLITTALLIGGFAYRFYKTDWKVYPSGIFLVICIVMFLRFALVHYSRSKNSKS